MQIVITTELPGDERTEVIARAIFAHRQYPGQKPADVPWPPKQKATLMQTWNLAQSVVAALNDANLLR